MVKIWHGLAVALLLPSLAQAKEWQIMPAESHIHWVATQKDEPVKGAFKTFTADIAFDPKALDQSEVTVTVDMASVSAEYDEVTSTLPKTEWFGSDEFPQATFTTKSIMHVSDQRYMAPATLTIKGVQVPVTLDFTFSELSDDKAVMEGTARVKRTDFGIGWPETDEVADPVKIEVRVTAVPKP